MYHSYYSLRYGTLSVEQLCDEAQSRGINTLTLTDINNTTGAMDFIRACNERKIKAITGADIRNGNTHLYTLIARNNKGFREVNEYITRHNLNKTDYPPEAPQFSDVYVIYPLGSKALPRLLDNEYLGIRISEVSKLISLRWQRYPAKLLIGQPTSFARPEDYELHLNLRAVDNNTLLSKVQAHEAACPNEWMRSPSELQSAYAAVPEIIENTGRLLDDCGISLDMNSIKNKKFFTGNRYDDRILLEKLAAEGMAYRYGLHNRTARERVNHELEIIDRLGFSAYFLITWDIIRYSMSRGFYHVGRGSGANSVVAYCLRITDVDPIELDLYFERFINPKRTSPPDFDIDYSWKERDDVQDYIFKRYGHQHTALLGAMSTFKGKSIIRELGKVHGLPKQEIDDLLRDPDKPTNNNALANRIKQIGRHIQDFPNLRSIHAGGILISEEPITSYVALDLPPKGFPTTQWDMYVAEEIGFEKLDILSQRGIGHIRETVEIVRQNKGISIDVHQVEKFKQDPKVKDQLKRAETNGCFYIESPAMRGLLTKLRCDNYLSLVAASSIIRPGVAKSGMMREYIYRFHNPGKYAYIHPVMEQQLKETYGVMVYQEDVLKICHHFAGLDLADADVLRRAMSGKHRSRREFDRIVEKFFSNCKAYGYPDEISKEVWRQIESFAGYSFSKAHSASYAVESFQSLWLKAHFPREFMVAVINNFGGFYPGWVYFNEARRCGANILLPCVNNSQYKTSIQGDDIYIGFIHIANLETAIGHQIPEERQQNGPFTGLTNFILRINPPLEQLILLIRCGALRFCGIPKARLLWQAHMEHRTPGSSRIPATRLPDCVTQAGHAAHGTNETHNRASLQPPVSRHAAHACLTASRGTLLPFIPESRTFVLPELEYNPLEDAYDEIELLGFPVSMRWFDLLITPFRGELMARDLNNNVGKTVRMLGELVTIKYVRTIRKDWMHFAAFLDAEGEFFDTVHFPDAVRQFPFRGHGMYLILGKVIEEFGFPSLNVLKMAKLPIQKDPRS